MPRLENFSSSLSSSEGLWTVFDGVGWSVEDEDGRVLSEDLVRAGDPFAGLGCDSGAQGGPVSR